MVAADTNQQTAPTTLTDTVRKHIRELRKQGHTRDQIAEELHVSKSSVWHAWNSYSLTEVAAMESAMRQVRDILMARVRAHVHSGGSSNPTTDQDFELVEILTNVLEG